MMRPGRPSRVDEEAQTYRRTSMGGGGLASEYKYAGTGDVANPQCRQAHGGQRPFERHAAMGYQFLELSLSNAAGSCVECGCHLGNRRRALPLSVVLAVLRTPLGRLYLGAGSHVRDRTNQQGVFWVHLTPQCLRQRRRLA
jgi:hypothetical protein